MTAPRVIVLFIVAPVCVVIGLFISAATTARENLHPTTALSASLLGFAIAFVVAAAPAIALTVVSSRARRRTGIVLGSVLAGIAVLFCGIPLASTTTIMTLKLWVNQAPLTEQESRYSVFELGVLSTEFLADSTAGLSEGEAPPASSRVAACDLSNLREGSRLMVDQTIVTSATQQEALDSIADAWKQAGHEVTQSETLVKATGTAWLDDAYAVWNDAGSVNVYYESICVVSVD